jgi:hypothetical protein
MNTTLRLCTGHTATKRRSPGAACGFYTNETFFTAGQTPDTLKDIMALAKKGFNRLKKSGDSFAMVSNQSDCGVVQISDNQLLLDLSGDNFISKWSFDIIEGNAR